MIAINTNYSLFRMMLLMTMTTTRNECTAVINVMEKNLLNLLDLELARKQGRNFIRS